MIALLIVLSVCLLVSLIFSGIAGYVLWNTVTKNFMLQDLQKEYKRFHSLMLDTLDQDTEFMRSELIKRLGMELPDVKSVNSAIVNFQNNLVAIRTTLKEYKMMED